MKSSPVLKQLSVLQIGLEGAATVQAAPVVTDWSYTLSADWQSYTLTKGATTSPAPGTKLISWGSGGAQSSLGITDPASDGVIQTQITVDSPKPGTTAAVITLTQNNFTIQAPILSSSVLRATLNLTASQPLDAVIGGPGGLPRWSMTSCSLRRPMLTRA